MPVRACERGRTMGAEPKRPRRRTCWTRLILRRVMRWEQGYLTGDRGFPQTRRTGHRTHSVGVRSRVSRRCHTRLGRARDERFPRPNRRTVVPGRQGAVFGSCDADHRWERRPMQGADRRLRRVCAHDARDALRHRAGIGSPRSLPNTWIRCPLPRGTDQVFVAL
jgi:hypothetical protein